MRDLVIQRIALFASRINWRYFSTSDCREKYFKDQDRTFYNNLLQSEWAELLKEKTDEELMEFLHDLYLLTYWVK